jgi:sulfur carrier protein
MTGQIQVFINGEPREVPAGLGVASLLEHLGMRADRVAIERNLEILPRSAWATTAVQAGDRFEIVHLVGGGSCADWGIG